MKDVNWGSVYDGPLILPLPNVMLPLLNVAWYAAGLYRALIVAHLCFGRQPPVYCPGYTF
jgi:hypothetical protein